MRRLMGLTLVSVALIAGCGGTTRTAALVASPAQSAEPAQLATPAQSATPGPTSATPDLSAAPDPSATTGFRDPAQPVCRVAADNTQELSSGSASPVHLSADFVVSRVDWCQGTTVARDGNTVAVLQQREATGDFSTFVTDLRGPDGPPAPTADIACASYADVLPELVVADSAGRVFAPRFPKDFCGHNYGNAARDFQKLAYRVVSQRDLEVIGSAESSRSGCSYQYKSLSDLYATNETPPTAGGPVASGGLRAPITECDYDRGSDGVGTLVSGTALGPAKVGALQQALASLPAAAPCSVDAPQFVLLQAHGGSVIIERGGCGRVAGNDYKLHAGSEAVTAALGLPNT